MQAETRTIAYFGKIPTHSDFVRHHASGEGVRAVDAWLQQGLYAARLHEPEALEAFGAARTPCAFYFDPGGDAPAVAGVLAPSRDRVGRAYPFLVAFEQERLGVEQVGQVPVRFGAFFEQAAALIEAATSGDVGPHDLPGRAEALAASALGREDAVAFDAYLGRTRVRAFWEHLWGFADDSRKYVLFKNLLDVTLPLRDGLPPGFALALRFPLGTDPVQAPYEAGVWVEVCLHLMQTATLHPAFFWAMPEDGAAAPSLLLTLRPPSAGTFVYLLPAPVDGDTLCDLEHMGTQTAFEAALSIPARYGELLESESLTLREFLHRLGS